MDAQPQVCERVTVAGAAVSGVKHANTPLKCPCLHVHSRGLGAYGSPMVHCPRAYETLESATFAASPHMVTAAQASFSKWLIQQRGWKELPA